MRFDQGLPETSAPGEESPSVVVVRAVAEAEETDPHSLPPLYDAINPKRLDACLQTHGFDRVSFTYNGHAVTVQQGGDVALR